jgi:hypothetical protein
VLSYYLVYMVEKSTTHGMPVVQVYVFHSSVYFLMCKHERVCLNPGVRCK